MRWLSLQNQFSACNYRVKIIFMGSPSDESVFMIVKYYGNTAPRIVSTKPEHCEIWIFSCLMLKLVYRMAAVVRLILSSMISIKLFTVIKRNEAQ